METSQADMKGQLPAFRAALLSFASSPSNFRIISSIPPLSSSLPASTLYVLDSSFNPPTLAHLRIATTALTQDRGSTPKRLLLLLATQNADKAPKPASFEQRLVMMSIFADDLRRAYRKSMEKEEVNLGEPPVDIALTKEPYFHAKASAISSSNCYPASTTQVHLTGFDTLIRIMDPKYYPPTHTLAPLEPFLGRHRLRVTYRTDAAWGDRAAQEEYLRGLAEGEKEKEGGRREWAQRIELVEGKKEGEEVVSSTRVREAAKKGDGEMLENLVTEGVAKWVSQEKLYVED